MNRHPPFQTSDETVYAGFIRSSSTQLVSRVTRPLFPDGATIQAVGNPTDPKERSWRLIGPTDLNYEWEKHWKPDEVLLPMKKSVRKYHERNNRLIQHYIFIDRLLATGLPHDLLQEYHDPDIHNGIHQQANALGIIDGDEYTELQLQSVSSILSDPFSPSPSGAPGSTRPEAKLEIRGKLSTIYREIQDNRSGGGGSNMNDKPTKSGPPSPRDSRPSTKNPTDQTPLLSLPSSPPSPSPDPESGPPHLSLAEETDTSSPIVVRAIWINTLANVALLALKIVVVVLSSSVSVLASLVDGALDLLSSSILALTTWMISRADRHAYPIGRRRLEPVGVLIFACFMVVAFVQVLGAALARLTDGGREVVRLTVPATIMMASTVVVKGVCWVWCRLVPNSSVRALAQDAWTDVVLNTFSIVFPLVGYHANLWWLDPLGGVLLSIYVIVNWSSTANEHIRKLTSLSASADERTVLLYLTMRFAQAIKQIQGLQAYHSGDKLNVEVDIILDEQISLRDSHDLGESLQHVVESLPNVDRAFVHMDYLPYNLPSHIRQEP